MVEFGWSVGCIIAAIETGNKIRKALQHTDGAKEQYAEATSFLEQSESILKDLERYVRDVAQSAYRDAIIQQLKLMERPWTKLETLLSKYEKSLGENSFRSKLGKMSGKVQWALRDLHEAVRLAKTDVLGPLQMIGCLLHVHSMETMRDMNEKCQKMIEELEVTDLANALQTGFYDLHRNATKHDTAQTETIKLIRQLHQPLLDQKKWITEILQKSDSLLSKLTDSGKVTKAQQEELAAIIVHHIGTAVSKDVASNEIVQAKLRSQQVSLDAIFEALKTLNTGFNSTSSAETSTPLTANGSSKTKEALAVLKVFATATSMFLLGYSAKSTTVHQHPATMPTLPASHRKQNTLTQTSPGSEKDSIQPKWANEFNKATALSQPQLLDTGSTGRPDVQPDFSSHAHFTQKSKSTPDSDPGREKEDIWFCCTCGDGPYSSWQYECHSCLHVQCQHCKKESTGARAIKKENNVEHDNRSEIQHQSRTDSNCKHIVGNSWKARDTTPGDNWVCGQCGASNGGLTLYVCPVCGASKL